MIGDPFGCARETFDHVAIGHHIRDCVKHSGSQSNKFHNEHVYETSRGVVFGPPKAALSRDPQAGSSSRSELRHTSKIVVYKG